MAVATIIAAYHQTNEEYLTGSFNERHIVIFEGTYPLSLSLQRAFLRLPFSCLSSWLLPYMTLDCLWSTGRWHESRRSAGQDFPLSPTFSGRFCCLLPPFEYHARSLSVELLSNI